MLASAHTHCVATSRHLCHVGTRRVCACPLLLLFVAGCTRSPWWTRGSASSSSPCCTNCSTAQHSPGRWHPPLGSCWHPTPSSLSRSVGAGCGAPGAAGRVCGAQGGWPCSACIGRGDAVTASGAKRCQGQDRYVQATRTRHEGGQKGSSCRGPPPPSHAGYHMLPLIRLLT